MDFISSLEPLAPYFIIKIGKAEQERKREYLTQHILANPGTIAMTREIQFGQIIKIGSGAQAWMPMAEPGDYLLCHHFVSGKKTEKGHSFYIIHEDEDFEYYAVNGYEIPGERPLAYAVAKGEEIIPTPDYIFLEAPKPDDNDYIPDVQVGENGLIVPGEKIKTRDQWTAIMKQNMARIQQLVRHIPTTPLEEAMMLASPEKKELHDFAIPEIKRLEKVNAAISKDINKKRLEPFVVSAVNPQWAEQLRQTTGETIHPGDTAYFLNMACNYILDFGGVDYIICESKYFSITQSNLKEAIHHATNPRYNITAEETAGRRGNEPVRN